MLLMLDALLHATARRELYYCNHPVGAAAANTAALLPKLLLKSHVVFVTQDIAASTEACNSCSCVLFTYHALPSPSQGSHTPLSTWSER